MSAVHPLQTLGELGGEMLKYVCGTDDFDSVTLRTEFHEVELPAKPARKRWDPMVPGWNVPVVETF